jgi:hypothetical protein
VAAALVAASLTAAGASRATARAATPTFSAHGSAEQVYLTGLQPNARMSLITPEGATRYTQQADSLGGLLFRNVPPGSGYRVRSYPAGVESGPITVHSDAAAPWDPSIYNQSIPDNGYTYLTTRDGTQLAIDVHPPTAPAGEPGLPLGLPVPPGLPSLPSGLPLPPLPLKRHASRPGSFDSPPISDADRVLGLRLCRSIRTRQRHRGAREPDGLRGGRRQHAGNGVLGRRV